jgi:penicillin amidase
MKRSSVPAGVRLRREGPAVGGLPVGAPVEVLYDRLGIPHIFARTENDLFTAQGYLHARDRLWQMETLRRFAAGTLAEITGEEAAALDHFSRLAGFSNLQTRALARLGEEDRRLFQAYADGVNAFLARAGGKLPLELRSLKLVPRPYTIEELGAAIPLNAWLLQANYLEELIAVLARRRLTAQQWNELFASCPGERLAEEEFFERFRAVEIAPLLPAALAFYPYLAHLSGGSNGWVVARGPGGRPLLANDPHLDTTVPQVWYFCHLHCPTLNVAGGSLPGLPGVIVGRNTRVAWSMTNLMTDCTDLYVLRVDPARPTRYYVGGRALEMEQVRAQIRIAGRPAREVTLYRTVHGAVLTEVRPGIEAVLALKWYGTLADGEMEDTTLRGLLRINRAAGAEELLAAARLVASVGLNLVYADDRGAIGRYGTGRIPIRRGYSGRLPADGSSGRCDWQGFVTPERNPQAADPPGGRIVAANQRLADPACPVCPSYSWTCPDRSERIRELLDAGPDPAPEDFLRIQMDRYSKRAERLLPAILGFEYRASPAREAAALLGSWDRYERPQSAAAALFQVFLVEFSRTLLAGLLGDALPAYLSLMPFMYTAPDRLLDAQAGAVPAAGGLLGGRPLREACEQGLVRAMRYLEAALGPDRRRWRWGALHTYAYRHPGARGAGPGGALARRLLNRGPYPAGGSANTVNQANFNPARGGSPKRVYETTAIPSLRLVTSLADPDSTRIIGPMGQSGRPLSRHYADMIPLWLRGEAVPLPLSRAGAEAVAVSRAILRP